jgi:hypothetical protein
MNKPKRQQETHKPDRGTQQQLRKPKRQQKLTNPYKFHRINFKGIKQNHKPLQIYKTENKKESVFSGDGGWRRARWLAVRTWKFLSKHVEEGRVIIF